MTIIDTPRHTNAVGYPGSVRFLRGPGCSAVRFDFGDMSRTAKLPQGTSLLTVRRLIPVPEVILALASTGLFLMGGLQPI